MAGIATLLSGWIVSIHARATDLTTPPAIVGYASPPVPFTTSWWQVIALPMILIGVTIALAIVGLISIIIWIVKKVKNRRLPKA